MFILGFEVNYCVMEINKYIAYISDRPMCWYLLRPDSRIENTTNMGLAVMEITFHKNIKQVNT